MVGTEVGVATAEIRFPILTPQMRFVPQGFPPIEGAIFTDIGLVWDEHSTIKWNREPSDDPTGVRAPLKVWGVSLRTNLFGFAIARVDFAMPQGRSGVGGLWTLSLGPAF
jgi:outer membrane protein assembly factor BamA